MVESMFIGTREKMLEVRCPSVTMPSSKIGWADSLNFLNGGASVRRSKAAAKQYEMTWGSTTRDEIRKILDLADGVYGDGEIYWVDPFVADRNMLPQYWASPFQGAYDGLPLVGTARGVLVDTPANTNNFPTKSITYDVVSDPTGVVAETNLVTNPSMEGVTAGTDSTKRTNLVTNPNSETSAIGSAGPGAGTASLSTTQKVSGTNSTKFVWGSGGWGAQPVNVAVTAGTTYTASFYIFSESGSIPLFLVQNQSYATVTSTGVYTTSTVGSWVRLNMTFTPAAGTTSVLIYGTTSSAATYYIDNVLVEAAPDVRSYFDGNYSEDPTLIEAWTGTVNNSTSTALVRGASNRENLFTNPSAENSSTVGFTANDASYTVAQSSEQKMFGTYSMKLTATSASRFFPAGYVSGANTVPATPNVSYTLSLYVYSPVAQNITARIAWLNGSTVISNTQGTFVSVAANTWTRVSVTGVAPATTTQMIPAWINQTNAAIGTVLYVDGLLLEQSTTVNPYFDGSYTDAPGWTTSWAGTANASRSVATAAPVTVRTNLVTNPSMETVTSGTVVMRRNLSVDPAATANSAYGSTLKWTPQWYGSGGAGTTSVITGQTGPVGALTTAIRKTWTTVGAAQDISYGFCNAGTNGYPVNAGTTYAVSMYYRTSWSNIDSTLINNRIVFSWYNSAGTLLSSAVGADFPHAGANVWTRVSAVVTAPANAAYLQTNHQFYTSILPSIGSTFDGTGLLVETSSVVGDYFDGSTTDALGWDYAWSGTANASISTAACAATTVRTNLVPNPSLETNILNIASFAGTGGTNALTRETSGGWIGTSFARATWSVGTTAVSGNMENVTSATTTVGATYTGSAYVRVNSAQRLVLQAIGTSVGTTTVTAVDVPANTWTRLSYTHANVTTAGTLNIRVGVSGGRNWVAGDTLDVDGWLLEASSTLGDYFDGSFNPAGDFSYAWTGTANASTSIQRGATVTEVAGRASSIVYGAKSVKNVGTQSCAVVMTSTTGGGVRVTLTGLTVGATYTMSGWVYIPSVNGVPSVIATVTNIGYGTSTAATNTWTRLSMTITANSTTHQFGFDASGTPAIGQMFFIDSFLIEASPIVQDYFDGSVVSADADLTNSWSGTPHASTSLMRGVGLPSFTNTRTANYQASSWYAYGSKSAAVRRNDSGDAFGLISLGTMTAPASKTYTAMLTAYAKTNTTIQGNTMIQEASGTFRTLGIIIPTGTVITSTPQTFSVTFSTPADVVSTFRAILRTGTNVGEIIYYDGLLLVEGTYTGAYFDGDSSETFNRAYVWTGTPHASTTQALELATQGRTVWIPIPTGHTAHIGAYGTKPTSSDAAVIATPTTGATTYGTPSQLTLLPVTSNARFNKTVKASDGYTGVEISIDGQGQLTLSGLMIQILKDGITPETGEFISGQGHSGCRFTTQPEYTPYSAAFDMVGAVVSLTETGAWSQ